MVRESAGSGTMVTMVQDCRVPWRWASVESQREDETMVLCIVVLLAPLLALLDLVGLLGGAHVVDEAGDKVGDGVLVGSVDILGLVEAAAFDSVLGQEVLVQGSLGVVLLGELDGVGGQMQRPAR